MPARRPNPASPYSPYDARPHTQGGSVSESTRKRPAPVRLALSPDEAAASLGVSRDYLDEHVSSELKWVRRGRRKLVAIKELESWLERSAARTLD